MSALTVHVLIVVNVVYSIDSILLLMYTFFEMDQLTFSYNSSVVRIAKKV